jgi:addiction module HigA family antidote
MNSYANAYEPDIVSPPGETLAELLEEREMSQAELAARIGRPKQLISEIASARKQITPETALQLERALGVSAGFWNTREARYRESLERREERERLAGRTEWLKRFPVRKMIGLGWLPERKDKVDQLRELLNYFGVSSPDQWDGFWGKRQLAFRKSEAFEVNLPALSAWLRRGEILGHQIRCEPFDAKAFEASLVELRGLTRNPDPADFVPKIEAICARTGVAVVFVPELAGCRASGVTQWLSPEKALVQLSLRYKTDDHLWFTVFHEAAHILKHPKKKVFVDYGSSPGSAEEAEADRFAAELLIPRVRLAPFARHRPFSKARIRALAAELGVSPGIVVGRLQHEGALPRTHCNDLKVRFEFVRQHRHQ